jgi:hypothetical protein
MAKRSLRRLLTVAGFVVLTLSVLGAASVALSAGSASAAGPALAASSGTNPMVVVIRDYTPTSGCVQTLIQNKGTSKEAHKTVSCPPGTIMALVHVR